MSEILLTVAGVRGAARVAGAGAADGDGKRTLVDRRSRADEESAPPAATRFEQVRVPTLVLIGEKDVYQRDHAEALAARVPGARLVAFPAAAIVESQLAEGIRSGGQRVSWEPLRWSRLFFRRTQVSERSVEQRCRR